MINPSEISEVLKQQLESVNTKVAFEEVGTVLEVGDGVAHVYGLDNVCANELVEFENGVKGVALNLEESNVGVILLNNVNKVTENMTVRRTGEIASIPVGEGLLGRVINVLGEPIDGRGPIQGKLPLQVEKESAVDRLNDTIITSLRTSEGFSIPSDATLALRNAVERHLLAGTLVETDDGRVLIP